MNFDSYQFFDQSRKLIGIKGNDAKKFLQGILTNDIDSALDSIIYTGILTPQGKYLYDFFVWGINKETFVIDIEEERVEELKNKLVMYRLRSDVIFFNIDKKVLIGLGKKPVSSFLDPRNPKLGWRKLVGLEFEDKNIDTLDNVKIEYEQLRIELGIPKYGCELIPYESFILEVGFNRLNGISFSKGCFVGQEVTARMKHKATLKNGLIRFRNAPDCLFGKKKIINEKGQTVGFLSSSINGIGLGLIKFLYAKGRLICDGNELKVLDEINSSLRI